MNKIQSLWNKPLSERRNASIFKLAKWRADLHELELEQSKQEDPHDERLADDGNRLQQSDRPTG